MSEAKHTPGPWKAVSVPSAGIDIRAKLMSFKTEDPLALFQLPDKTNIVFRLNDKGELWGSIAYEAWVQFKPPGWEQEQEANARLIAAAPDLLDAVKEVGIDDVRHGTWTKIMNAIAKAET